MTRLVLLLMSTPRSGGRTTPLVVKLCRAACSSYRPGVWMARSTPSSRTGQECNSPFVACLVCDCLLVL